MNGLIGWASGSSLISQRNDMKLVVVVVIVAVLTLVWLVDRLLDLLFVRRVPIAERESGWLALAAPYFAVHSFRAGDLGGKTPMGRAWIRHLLKKDWGIVDRQSAIEQLDWLLRSGHRNDPEMRDVDQPDVDLELVDRALLAWDAMRIVFVARSAYACGYLEEAGTWSFVYAAVGLARQGGFGTWAQWGRSFVVGRMLWSAGKQGNAHYEMVVERLLRKRRSPWNCFDWRSVTRGT